MKMLPKQPQTEELEWEPPPPVEMGVLALHKLLSKANPLIGVGSRGFRSFCLSVLLKGRTKACILLAAARSHHGGLTPDLVIPRFYLPSSDGLPLTRTSDVKTAGYSEKYYRASIARGRAADTRPGRLRDQGSEGGR